MLKYLVMYDNSLRPIDVVSQTECFFTVSTGQRFKKNSDYGVLFDGFIEAKNFALGRLDKKISAAARIVEVFTEIRSKLALVEPPE